MQNFTYHNPTKIVFGKGSIAELRRLVPPGKIVLTYGGGSIVANGVYDQVRKALGGRDIVEFGGIPPNPVYEHLLECVKLVKETGAGFLLAVGGGSVLDGTKFIAAAVHFTGSDPWDMLSRGAPARAAVPLGAVLTLSATGSESNSFAVISRKSTQEKLAFSCEHVFPRFAILDPTTTMSLPEKQTRNGIVDAFVHVMEQYATVPCRAALQDRQAEAILLTLIEEGPKTLKDPSDPDARANLVWCATQALNGLIGCGVVQDWATHMIGHELTALYGIDHAESLAIVLPSLLYYQRERKGEKLLQYGRRIWGVALPDPKAAAASAIERTREFFESLGMRTRLDGYGISSADASRRVSERFRKRGSRIGEGESLGFEDVDRILENC